MQPKAGVNGAYEIDQALPVFGFLLCNWISGHACISVRSMKLDKAAIQLVFAEVDALSNWDSASSADGKAIAVGLIELYLQKLGAKDGQTATINLTNARAGLLAIMQTCQRGEQELNALRTESNKELCDAFVKYLRILIVQADAHYSGHLN